MTIGFVLQLDRAARMVAQHAVDPSLPGLEEVIDRLTKATFDAPTATPYEAEVRRAEERVLVDRVMWLATASPNAQVRAIASLKLSKLATRLQDGSRRRAKPTRAQHTLLAADIKRFLERPAKPTRIDAARPTRRRARRSATPARTGSPRRPGIRQVERVQFRFLARAGNLKTGRDSRRADGRTGGNGSCPSCPDLEDSPMRFRFFIPATAVLLLTAAPFIVAQQRGRGGDNPFPGGTNPDGSLRPTAPVTRLFSQDAYTEYSILEPGSESFRIRFLPGGDSRRRHGTRQCDPRRQRRIGRRGFRSRARASR